MEVVEEVGEVGEDVDAARFREEPVVGCYEDGGGLESEGEWPVRVVVG